MSTIQDAIREALAKFAVEHGRYPSAPEINAWAESAGLRPGGRLHSTPDGVSETDLALERILRTQTFVDTVCHYRNLAIELGAKPEQMVNTYDRELAEKGFDTDLEGWNDDTKELWQELETVEAEVAALRSRVTELETELGAARGRRDGGGS